MIAVWSAPDWLLPPLARWLNVGVVPERVDYVMALGGDAERRPFVAAELVKAGLAEKALVPESATNPDVEDGIVPASHEIIRDVLRVRGVAENRIVILRGAAESTADEMQQLRRFLATHPDATVAIVTSAYHTRRARWTVNAKAAELGKRLSIVSAPNGGFYEDQWWRTEAGFRMVTTEYLKLFAYWFRYGNGFYWCAAVALVASCLLIVKHRRSKSVRRRRAGQAHGETSALESKGPHPGPLPEGEGAAESALPEGDAGILSQSLADCRLLSQNDP